MSSKEDKDQTTEFFFYSQQLKIVHETIQPALNFNS